ncbi:MAG: hypothetical protein WAV31_03610 [Candidatus Moraniibacteriota bacterium]
MPAENKARKNIKKLFTQYKKQLEEISQEREIFIQTAEKKSTAEKINQLKKTLTNL